ncbi:MAG: class I SAM-dependent methyltransferase [Hyphomicrobiales bacterium]|nr:class I SAM-dependent methyltransferase [Hyphomicrobiales bacterium]
MTDDSRKTLFHPFETGDLPIPPEGTRVLFSGAEPGLRLPAGFAADLALAQPFRPSFRALEEAGFEISPRAEGAGYDAAFVLCGRHRRQNEARIADALTRVREGGLVLVAGSKVNGIDSLRRKVAGTVPLAGSLAKYHGIAFWFPRPVDAPAAVAVLAPAGLALVDGRFRTAPGMFSPDHVDPGSRLLVESLPDDISGDVADFGAGWGYLSAELLSRSDAVSRIDLYEADFEALEAARRNLAGSDSAAQTGFFWSDLLAEPIEGRYDFIVMNPPFHAGRAAAPTIGQGMILAAARALKPRGRLYLVANRQLPYEEVLARDFRKSGETVRDASYKVLWAVRR